MRASPASSSLPCHRRLRRRRTVLGGGRELSVHRQAKKAGMWVRAATWFVVLVLLAAAVNLPLAIRAIPARRAPVAPNVNVFGAEAAARGWPSAPPLPWPAVTQWSESTAFAFRRRTAWCSNGSTTTHQMQVDEFGWPTPALKRVQYWWPWDDPQWSTTEQPDTGLMLQWGVVANPVLVGAAAWVILVAPALAWFVVRKWSRRRRTLCPNCAYPIGSSEQCTECGAPVRVA